MLKIDQKKMMKSETEKIDDDFWAWFWWKPIIQVQSDRTNITF